VKPADCLFEDDRPHDKAPSVSIVQVSAFGIAISLGAGRSASSTVTISASPGVLQLLDPVHVFAPNRRPRPGDIRH
jgi:hypothetical protein